MNSGLGSKRTSSCKLPITLELELPWNLDLTKLPRDWENLFVKSRVRHIVHLHLTNFRENYVLKLCFELSGGPETLGWTVGVSSVHFNQHKKCANARFSLFFFAICIFRFLWQVISTSSGVFPGTGIDLQFVLIFKFQ